jgi:hypothetical protein
MRYVALQHFYVLNYDIADFKKLGVGDWKLRPCKEEEEWQENDYMGTFTMTEKKEVGEGE